MMGLAQEIWKETRVKLFVLAVIFIGLIPLAFKGLTYGMDFTGGSIIEIKLDRALHPTEMQSVVTVLQNRLNAYGLKDIAVRPWGNEYIVVEIAETDPQAINQLQSLLGQQGKFEALFNGELVLSGTDIVSVVTDPQRGFGVRQDNTWVVPFFITNEAANRFARAIEGQCTLLPNSGDQCVEHVYMFIDRPENAVILMPNSLYQDEKSVPLDFESSPNTVLVDEMVENSGAELVVSDVVDANVRSKIGNKTVIVPEGEYDIAVLNQTAATVVEKPKTKKYWIQTALNIEDIVHLTKGVTAGNPITEPSITGRASSIEEATRSLNRLSILLKSGKLPVSVSVGSVSTISPTLGPEFLRYSIYAALGAMLAVVVVILIAYRRIKIALPILFTSMSEVVMILGIAALIGWQIDLAAVAGLVAAVGTGVDHQIIITDEVLRREQEYELSTLARIQKAFSIIFMAAATIILAMLPLLFMGLGVLKGFAIITILGSLIGVFIARPAYAAVIRKLVG
jgi:preprotein translocase subunit SecD